MCGLRRLRGIPGHAGPPVSRDHGLVLSCDFVLFRVPFCLSCHRPSAMVAFLEVLLSFATSVRESTCDGVPTRPSMFRPQCFAHSRRVTPHCTLRVYFAPLPRTRFLFRGFPQQPADATFARRTLLSFTSHAACRLQGLHPIVDPLYLPKFYLLQTLDPLLSFLLLRVFLYAPCQRLHVSSTLDLLAYLSL